MNNDNRGSKWNKWDLHFHTQSSYDYKDKSITDEELIETLISNDIKVVAITDHHIIDISRINNLKNIANNRLTILPGIEFLSDSRGRQPIHFIGIFSETSDLNYIWGQIEHRTEIKKIRGEGKKQNEVYCNLQSTIELIHELGGIVSIHAGDKHSSIENITHSLPHGEAQKTDIAHMVDIYELGKETDQEGYIKHVFPAIKKNIPMIICSDNHNVKDYKIKQNCWIKANPTFEGLKQITYEPSRVYIGENKPQEALHKIDSLELKFEHNTRWENEKFCFSGFQETIYFSPYLTCVIGGRGSGKSTLLNLIAEKIDKAEKNFFSELNPKEVKSKVLFFPEEIENIEFLAQNKVEEFAKDSKKFTEAIFKRLDKNIGGTLLEKENNITNGLKTFDNQIDLLIKRATLHSQLQEKQKELKQFENIVKTLNDKSYLENKEKLQLVQKKLLELQNSRNQIKELYEKLISIQNEYKDISDPKNNYDHHYNELYHDISTLITKFKTKDYSEDKQEIESLEKEKQQYISAIEDYLKNKGMNEENIRDAQYASSNIEHIKNEIDKLKKEIKSVKQVKNTFSHDNLDSQIDDFEKIIVEQLSHINDKFDQIAVKNSDNVKNIKIEYQVDKNVFEAVFDQFLHLLYDYAKINIRERATFKNYLREISLDDVISYNKYTDFKNTLESTISNKKSQTYQIMSDIFSQKLYFQIYQLIIFKNIKNIKTNKLLKVFYDDRALDNTSFGQRCTAAIVILISLGNNPIIIDEPEAHLDSSLIANYLVDLIKDKKQHRQIIFATHNANFVLNADAELIVKLENNNGDTKANSFAIENLDFRSDLFKLEGGKEAFQKREKKYGVHS
ncbi:MAG: TrlF family AAA-like ATPase [Thermotogota bacterium]